MIYKLRCWPNVGLIMGHHLQRWTNIKTTLGKRLSMWILLLYKWHISIDNSPICPLQGFLYHPHCLLSHTPYSANIEYFSSDWTDSHRACAEWLPGTTWLWLVCSCMWWWQWCSGVSVPRTPPPLQDLLLVRVDQLVVPTLTSSRHLSMSVQITTVTIWPVILAWHSLLQGWLGEDESDVITRPATSQQILKHSFTAMRGEKVWLQSTEK